MRFTLGHASRSSPRSSRLEASNRTSRPRPAERQRISSARPAATSRAVAHRPPGSPGEHSKPDLPPPRGDPGTVPWTGFFPMEPKRVSPWAALPPLPGLSPRHPGRGANSRSHGPAMNRRPSGARLDEARRKITLVEEPAPPPRPRPPRALSTPPPAGPTGPFPVPWLTPIELAKYYSPREEQAHYSAPPPMASFLRAGKFSLGTSFAIGESARAQVRRRG